jgi:hypothetical protein
VSAPLDGQRAIGALYVDIEIKDLGVPRAFLRASRFLNPALRDAVGRTLDGILTLFDQSVEHFDAKPVFNKSVSGVGSSISGRAGTKDPIYALLSRGSPSHYISVRTATELVFPPFFRPKTAVNTLTSSPGGKFGVPQFRGQVVWHPGFRGRQYDQQIYKALQDKNLFPEVTVREVGDSMIRAGLKIIGFRR